MGVEKLLIYYQTLQHLIGISDQGWYSGLNVLVFPKKAYLQPAQPTPIIKIAG